MKGPLKNLFVPLTTGLLMVSLVGCSMNPPGAKPTATSVASIPPSGYEPQQGDDMLKRDQVFLDAKNSRVLILESLPVQVNLMLNGSLSDPCHQLRVVVAPANPDKAINLEVYSVFNPKMACITVIKDFSAIIPLGSYSGGHYMVYVNGQLVGEFDA